MLALFSLKVLDKWFYDIVLFFHCKTFLFLMLGHIYCLSQVFHLFWKLNCQMKQSSNILHILSSIVETNMKPYQNISFPDSLDVPEKIGWWVGRWWCWPRPSLTILFSVQFTKLDDSTDCWQAEIKFSKIPSIIFVCLTLSHQRQQLNCKINQH